MTEMVPVLANTWDLAEQCLREVAEGRLIFLDTETSGLDTQRNHIVGYVLKRREERNSYYVPVRHLGGGNLPGCEIPQTPTGWRGDLHPFEVKLAQIAKASGHRRWVGHNLDFDLKMSARHGILYEGDLEDTMNNQALIDERGRFSLDAVAKYLEVTAKLGTDLYRYIAELMDLKFPDEEFAQRKLMEHYWRTDASNPVVYEYAAGDDITTEEVWAEQQKILDEENLRKVWGVENRLVRTLFRMTRRGVRIDEDQLQRVHDKFGGMVDSYRSKFPEGFKSNAPSQIIKYLGDEIGPNWPRNAVTAAQIKKAAREGTQPLGALKFDEKTLERSPKGKDILLSRKIEHAQSAFTTPMIERHLINGRCHTTFNQMKRDDYGTVSGRLSSSDPNLQQVPKRDKVIGPIYRTIFLPEEGHYWDTNDYKQQEYVVFTNYTRIPKLVAGYTANPIVDMHQTTADTLRAAGFDWIERDPHGKRINLAILYGMGVPKLAASLGCSLEEATAIMKRLTAEFPEIKGTPSNPGFMRKAEKAAIKRGFVFTYLGRRRRYDRDNAYAAGNGVIQGSSADITKAKMVEVDEYFDSIGNEAHLMLQVHDALDFSIPEGRKDLADEARRIMTSFGPNDLITMQVPLGLDTGIGRNWSIATYGEERVAKAFAL